MTPDIVVLDSEGNKMTFDRKDAQIARAIEVGANSYQINAWREGEVIQKAMPNLSASDREYILTGISDDEWDKLFGKGEDV